MNIPLQRTVRCLLAVTLFAACSAVAASPAAVPAPAPAPPPEQPTPSVMKAVRMHEYGDASRLTFEDAPVPRPAKGQILLRVRAAGVNPVDWKIRSGAFKGGLDFPLPVILGFDVAGEVERVGEGVSRFKKGDRVFAFLALSRAGGYAQFAVVDQAEAARMPDELDFARAAATPLAALTAWQCLFDKARLEKGQTVLVHAGAGGVGHFAVQLAKWKGAKVIATASSANSDFLKKLGADQVVDYKAVRFEDVVKDVDVVLDTVGEDTTNRSAAVLRKGGILVSIVGDPDPAVFAARGARAVDHLVEPNGAQLARIADLLRTRELVPHISLQLPLSDAAKAQTQSESGRTRGKIVLTVD